MMKLTRRRRIYLTIFATLACGMVAIVFMPGPVEGVYAPFSTMGCDCDQFMEFRDGRVASYVMNSEGADPVASYERDAAGGIVVSFPPGGAAASRTVLARARPYLLGTRFFYDGEGNSEWKWKRYVTAKMRDHMAGR